MVQPDWQLKGQKEKITSHWKKKLEASYQNMCRFKKEHVPVSESSALLYNAYYKVELL